MGIENRSRGSISGGSVTSSKISLGGSGGIGSIKQFVGRVADATGRIAASDVIDFEMPAPTINSHQRERITSSYVKTIDPEELESINKLITSNMFLMNDYFMNGNAWVNSDKLIATQFESFIKNRDANEERTIDLIDGSRITISGNKTIYFNAISNETYTYEGTNCTSIVRENLNVKINLKYDEKGNIESYDVKLIDDNIFNDINNAQCEFGGAQGGLKDTKFLEDPVVIEIMKKSFPDATVEDYQLYFAAMANCGCGHIAFTNYVFSYFQQTGRQDEFEELFGFPMYTATIDGHVDYNYEYLYLDMVNYGWANVGYTIQELYGDIELDAEDGSITGDISTRKIKGINVYDHDVLSDLTLENYNNSKYADLLGNPKVAEVRPTYTTWNQWFFERTGYAYERDHYDLKNDVVKYECQPGTDEWYEVVRSVPSFNEEQMLAEGTSVYKEVTFHDLPIEAKKQWFEEKMNDGVIILSGIDFKLLKANGEEYYSGGKNIKGHAVTVVGVVDLGVEVSSWGQKYIIPWDELDHFGNTNVFHIEQ